MVCEAGLGKSGGRVWSAARPPLPDFLGVTL